MLAKQVYVTEKLKQIPTRDGYGQGLVLAGKEQENVVVLCADLSESTRTYLFQKEFPSRFIQIGVAEQNLVTVASGMAAAGKIPFISSYAMFCPGRAWEQIRTTICYNEMNVKIAGAHAGISVGPDGATHQAIEDIAIMRVLPNMTVIVPCDAIETRKATMLAARHKGPLYLRFARAATPVFTTEKTPFKIGKAHIFKKGRDVTIIACGPLVHEALLAAKALESQNISCEVINNATIKPLDKKTILQSVKKTKAVVTVEEHQKKGGMGSEIVEFLATHYPVAIEMIGIDDQFGESGEPKELLEKFGLTAPFIQKAVRAVLRRKNS